MKTKKGQGKQVTQHNDDTTLFKIPTKKQKRAAAYLCESKNFVHRGRSKL